MTVLATIPVSEYPVPLGVDTIANKVYCAGRFSDSVTVICGAGDSIVCTIRVGRGPRALAWNHGAGRFYVSNYSSSSISVLHDSTVTGIRERGTPDASRFTPEAHPTIVRNVLFLPEAYGVGRHTFCALLDVTGRKVIDLVPGENDVRHLAPGVYFVRRSMDSGERYAVSKVITQK